MRRAQVEALLINAAVQGPDFKITVPSDELSATLTILKHLELAGQMTGFSHREAEVTCENCGPNCGCINIYGYTG